MIKIKGLKVYNRRELEEHSPQELKQPSKQLLVANRSAQEAILKSIFLQIRNKAQRE
jgi:hypothetical protein